MINVKQNGAAVLALLAIALIVFTGYFISTLSINQQRIQRVQKNVHALAKAKEALLGYALSQTPPGILPCPDQDGDGQADIGGTGCAVQRGFLPIQTLNLGPLRDTSGARLWYAVELAYTEAASGIALNASLRPSLRVNGSRIVAAVILAPGPVLGNQSRTNNNAREYLEEDNADADTTRYIVNKSDDNNDDLLALPISEFWSLMEKRVLRSAADALNAYRNTVNCGDYPFAANRSAPFDSQAALEIGTLPIGVALPSGSATGCPTAITLPLWLTTHWSGELHYALCGPSGSQCLTVTGDINRQGNALLISPGAAISTQIRPSSMLSEYFEAENNDSDFDFVYYTLGHHNATFNDTLYLFD